MISDYLFKALLSVVAILEDGAKFGLDSHAAVNALESVGFELDQMEDRDRQEFAEIVERVAELADPEQREWIRGIPRDLGIEM
ncbi:hypothetical protein E0H26_06330 [Micromonospora zingiberis]|uniref:Uncharacterized protein n=1 Tax=Micromonospora zingiberis TaxID=2053011 RepID=A0A4R0GT16_9ACTN|nr:hypothetical protein [Micromonospora zingiberis]TCB99019.1 hypothetical protein E0H26_06330 [Micromonospora zingiberis]